MDNPEKDEMPELPTQIGVELDREALAPKTFLIMCGLTDEEIADEISEFADEPTSRAGMTEQEEVLEITAFRVAEILDTILQNINQTAIYELGRKFLLDVAFMTLSQVVIEQRAGIRHQNQELDHNCQTEQCPYFWIKVEKDEMASDLYSNSGITPATKLDTSAMWESEW